ncbi:glycosyltransferase [Lichenicoccus sp.]|uniref:glycosyltransferase n=1 Tax=Lichenicoccus sp. TaxID=2781899 RepID=UPI003D0D977C
MTAATIHLDLSEIVATPLRTGIQRVEREAIRHWPGPARLQPCCVDATGQLLLLPDAVLDILCAVDDEGTAESREAERQALQALVATATPVATHDLTRLLNLELFFGATRAEAHLRIAKSGVRVLWYLYDFLPFLRPELFPQGATRGCNYFLRGLRSAGRVAFLSQQTKYDYAARIARSQAANATGPVIGPGADGLGLERQAFSSNRRDFVSIGTVEPRKNTIGLLRGFEALWQRGHNVRLVIGGRLSPDAAEALEFFERYAGDPRLVVLEQPSDELVRRFLREARAVVMPSEAEGFGLPPYEALHAGIPAVASMHLPSAAAIPRGTLLLARMDPISIAAAVESLLNDETAASVWDDAASVRLPTWADFGRVLGDWAQAC